MDFRHVLARLSVAVALVTTMPAGVCGAGEPQTAQPPAEESSPTSAAETARIKKALEQPSSGLLESASKLTERLDGTTYRVNVTEKPLNIWDFWGEPATAVAPYVRSWYFSNWHEEYLRMVTPDYARRAALYPGGMISVPVPALVEAVKGAMRIQSERRTQEEVHDALEQFFEEHPEARFAAPGPPPAPPPSRF